MKGAVTKGSDEIKVMYTNTDGIISRKLELVDYIKEETRNCMPSRHKNM